MTERGVRFGPGSSVSPGEYRNCDTGEVRYFDGNTPLPGGVNSASWEQVSDHYHAREGVPQRARSQPENPGKGVVFPPGTLVSPGEYRNVQTGAVRYFDGSSPLPGSANSGSWQQVSDHFHAQTGPHEPTREQPDHASRPVRFAPGALVSPGEYRNCDTGKVRYFDGNTPLPGGVNAASWEQISDHYHAEQHSG